MIKLNLMKSLDILNEPLSSGKDSRLVCTGCGRIHEINLGQAQVFSWSIDRNLQHKTYNEFYFQADQCPHCSDNYKNLEIRKIELIPLYNELCKDYFLN